MQRSSILAEVIGAGDKRQAARQQKFDCSIVEGRWACSVRRVAIRNINDHSLSRASEEHPIGVGQISFSIVVINVLPLRACKAMKGPLAVDRSKVGIPADPDPIK